MPDANLGTVETLLKRFADAQAKRLNWEDLWETAFQYAIPHKEVFSGRSKGEQQNVQVYDETAVKAVPKFATRLQAALVPPWSTWAKLVPGTDVDPDQAAQLEGFEGTTVAEIFEELTDTMFAHIHQSNFSSQAFESFQDLSIAPGCLLCNSDPVNTITFSAVPISEVYLELGPEGAYETVWRKHEVKGRNIKRKWPEAQLSTEMEQSIETDPEKEHTIIEGTIFVPETGDYHLEVIHEKQKHAMVERNLGPSSPWIIFPWNRTPGEVYSRGPVISVLPAILDLNKMWEFILSGAAWKVFGLWTGVDDGVWNPYAIKMQPGTVIPVGSNATNNPSIAALDVGGDLPFTDWFIGQKQSVIEQCLFANPIGDVEETPVRTLGENMLRMREMLEQSGASFSLLETEFVSKVIKRVMFLLQEAGKIPTLDNETGLDLKIDGTTIQIKMQSPIAQARDAQELGALEQFVVSAAGALGPEALGLWMDPEETIQYVRKQTGIPADLLRTESEVNETLQQMAELAQQQNEEPV